MKKGNALLIGVLVITLMTVSAGIAFFVAKNMQTKETVLTEATSSPTPTLAATTTPIVSALPEEKTVVVYESEASIPANDRSQLQTRIVEPVVDYYETEAKDPAVSIKVKINTQVNKADFPYLFEYILKSGANGGGVITKANGEINWWYPECLNGCNLSSEFAAKYPVIDALVQ